MGSGSGQDHLAPVLLSGLRGVVSITAGEYHACAVQRDGGVYCWGHNGDGQLGDGSQKQSPVPQRVAGIRTAVAAFAGPASTCVVLRSGDGRCWGADESLSRRLWSRCPRPETYEVGGRGGDFEFFGEEQAYCPRPAPLPGLAGVQQLAPGAAHVCALLRGYAAPADGSSSG